MRWVITGLLALVLCGGCAGARSPSGAATPTPGEWKTYGAQVVGVKPGPMPTPQPIGDRTLGFGFDGTWVRDGDGYRRCHQSLGCQLPANPCDPHWARAVRDSLDVPRNSSYQLDHCDPQWMVISVNLNSTACGAAPRPDCKPEPRIYRYFLRWKENGWREAAVGACRWTCQRASATR